MAGELHACGFRVLYKVLDISQPRLRATDPVGNSAAKQRMSVSDWQACRKRCSSSRGPRRRRQQPLHPVENSAAKQRTGVPDWRVERKRRSSSSGPRRRRRQPLHQVRRSKSRRASLRGELRRRGVTPPGRLLQRPGHPACADNGTVPCETKRTRCHVVLVTSRPTSWLTRDPELRWTALQ